LSQTRRTARIPARPAALLGPAVPVAPTALLAPIVLLALAALVVLAEPFAPVAREARAGEWHSRVLVAGSLRQLRSVRLSAMGQSALAASAPASRQRLSALYEARKAAVERVRAALREELARRGLRVTFSFPGRDDVDAAFVLAVREPSLAAAGREAGNAPVRVEITAEVAYVLELAPEGAWPGAQSGTGLPDRTLKMTPAGQPAAPPDRKTLQKEFERAMEDMGRSLRERLREARGDGTGETPGAGMDAGNGDRDAAAQTPSAATPRPLPLTPVQ
jgi:NAD(P)-dependent dehydrogenase (short-subunit alcohol dehydrogenase family)